MAAGQEIWGIDTPRISVVAWARFGTMTAYEPVGITHDIDDLTEGFWAVVIDFESTMTAIRFTRRGARTMTRPPDYRPWRPLTGAWRTSQSFIPSTPVSRRPHQHHAQLPGLSASIAPVGTHDLRAG